MLELDGPSPMLGIDDFIYGRGESGESYITHIKFPRFVAFVSVADLKPCLSKVVWWEERPFGLAFDNLLERAVVAIEKAISQDEIDIAEKINRAVNLTEEQFNIKIDTLRDSEERMTVQAQELVNLAEEQQLNIEKRKTAERSLLLSEEQLQIQISEMRDSEERMALQAQELVGLAEGLQAAEQEMKFLAHHDALTKLPSRRLCMDRLEQAMAEDRKQDTKTAVLFIDLDGFKAVNDTIGHEAGDAVLVAVAERMKTIIKKRDTVARIGGDEFILLLRDAAVRVDVEKLAQKVITELSVPLSIHGRDVKIGASIGIAFSPDDGMSPEDLLRNADKSMYVIKRRGKNNYRFFTQEYSEFA
ncbi:MAG: diguanylate cyclase [Halopseudomonas aestusnigri]